MLELSRYIFHKHSSNSSKKIQRRPSKVDVDVGVSMSKNFAAYWASFEKSSSFGSLLTV